MKLFFNRIENFSIVIPKNCSYTIKTAASELADYVKKVLNISLKINFDSIEENFEILLGECNRKEVKEAIKCTKTLDYALLHKNDKLLIFGYDDKSTLFGVYAFIEKYLGVRWFSYDCEDILTDKIKDFNDDIIYKSIFDYKTIVNYVANDKKWLARQRIEYNCGPTTDKDRFADIKGVKFAFSWGYFAHTFDILLPFNEYYENHSEYFSFAKGYEGVNGRHQICLTNKDVFNIVLKNAKEHLIANPDCDIISISQNDSWGEFENNYCVCKNCLEQYKKYQEVSGALIDFVNRIAIELEKDFPKIKVHTLAYCYSTKPPKNIICNDNVVVQLCATKCVSHSLYEKDCVYNKQFLDYIFEWTKICKNVIVWNYTSSYGLYAFPLPNIFTLQEDINFYAKNGIKGLLQQGNQNGYSADFETLRVYLTAKLYENPLMSKEEYNVNIDEFLKGYYGDGWQKIKEYIVLINNEGQNNHFTFNREYLTENFYSKNLLDSAENLWNEAYKLAQNDIFAKRIRQNSLQIKMCKQLSSFKNECKAEEKAAYSKENYNLFKELKANGISYYKEGFLIPADINLIDCSYRPTNIVFKKQICEARTIAKNKIEEEKWQLCKNYSNDFSFKFKLGLIENTLILLIYVNDDDINTKADLKLWEQDCAEIYLSEIIHDESFYKDDDWMIRINADGNFFTKNSFASPKINAVKTKNGYKLYVELNLKSNIKDKKEIGFEIMVHNFSKKGYETTAYFNSNLGSDVSSNPLSFGILKFVE